VLFYATGGLAVAGINASYLDGTVGSIASSNTTRLGAVVGGGIEAAVDRHWTVKVEYLYMDLGRINALAAGTSTATTVLRNNTDFFTAVATTQTLGSAFSTHLTDNIVRVGFNYKFDPFR
jgi:outer membrane immunogenic protein